MPLSSILRHFQTFQVAPDALSQARGLSPVKGAVPVQCMGSLHPHLGCPWVLGSVSGKELYFLTCHLESQIMWLLREPRPCRRTGRYHSGLPCHTPGQTGGRKTEMLLLLRNTSCFLVDGGSRIWVPELLLQPLGADNPPQGLEPFMVST